MKALAQAGLPGYVGDITFIVDYGCAARGADGYFIPKTGWETAHTIGISPLAIVGDRWREVILQEVRHALHDCGEGASYDDLEQDIRDLRNQASFAHFMPGSRRMELTHEEAKLLQALQSGDHSLRSEQDFRMLMALIAKTQDATLSKSSLMSYVDGSGKGGGKVVSLAIKHFDLIREISSCFAKRSFGDEFPSRAELQAKQVRLNEIVGKIYKDYKQLPQEQLRVAGGGHSLHQEAPDSRELLRYLENSLNLPQGSLAGPESVTHHSGDPGGHYNADNILPLEDPLSDKETVEPQELSEEDKRILSEAHARAAQADTSLWQCPKELWEEVVSQWSETSVSNGRRTDPNGSLQIDEIFSGVRPEDARVSPGADVEMERKVIRLVDLTSQLTPHDLGLCKELFHLGFSIALGDREPVSSCLALCVQEQKLGFIQRADVATRLSPAEQRCSELLRLQELKSHLEAVTTYAALSKGVELLEQKSSGSDISTAKKIEWPKLTNSAQTNEIVLHYLEDNQGVLGKLQDLTNDTTQSKGQATVELYMEKLEAALGQIEELDRDERIAQEAIDSYNFDPATGESTFTRPAGVTDVQLMRALNTYFRKHFPHFNRDAVYEGHLHLYEDLPNSDSDDCKQRDYSHASTVTITAVVKRTKGKDRITQEAILRQQGLVFSDPRDQAIAAALHACKHNGKDLFKGLCVRGSVPGFALITDRFDGVNGVGWCLDDDDLDDVAASGSPSPE
jgi:hypothetical protein